jgi:hypothetical protein
VACRRDGAEREETAHEDEVEHERAPERQRDVESRRKRNAAALPLSRFATVVYAERGTVLVTQERDREDHVLEKGDILVLPAGRQVVAWALTDATVSVCDAFVTDAALRATERGVVAAA